MFLIGRVLDEDYWYSGLLGGGLSSSHIFNGGRVLDGGRVLNVVTFLTGEDY